LSIGLVFWLVSLIGRAVLPFMEDVGLDEGNGFSCYGLAPMLPHSHDCVYQLFRFAMFAPDSGAMTLIGFDAAFGLALSVALALLARAAWREKHMDLASVRHRVAFGYLVTTAVLTAIAVVGLAACRIGVLSHHSHDGVPLCSQLTALVAWILWIGDMGVVALVFVLPVRRAGQLDAHP